MNGTGCLSLRPLIISICGLFLVVLVAVEEVNARPPPSECLQAKEDACVWVSWDGPQGSDHQVHMGKPCPQKPGCGCQYHGQCVEDGRTNQTVIFLCKNKKTGKFCGSDIQSANSRRFSQKSGKELGGSVGNDAKSRRRRSEAKVPRTDSMQGIPPVLRKIINRHRLQNPQSFGAGTFFLSGFSHINETLLLMNVVDAHKMQEDHRPPRGHVLSPQGRGQKIAVQGKDGSSVSSTTTATTRKATTTAVKTTSTTAAHQH